MGQPPHWGAAEGGACVSNYCISQMFMDIPYIFHIYSLNMFHILSLVCFLVYGVKSSFGHDQISTFGPLPHASGPKMTF